MQLEFDLNVKNAMTDEEYDDENMLLPRGTRVVVQRLPAAKGQGLLARIARADAGMTSGVTMKYGNSTAADNGFYTIQSGREDDEEFVDTNNHNHNHNPPVAEPVVEDSEEKELAALKAVTDQAGSMYRPNTSLNRSAQPAKFAPAGSGAPPPTTNTFKAPTHQSFQSRPNADPELREQERLMARQEQPTKRRATGIPRTFLNIPPSTTINADGEEEGEGIKLQPNVIGFQALVNRGGGQSGSGKGAKRRDLDYALKLTATEIPEHLQCGICAQVVKNAMLIPWDMEGRTACEMCMRDGLANNAFRCPLTGQDGVSPDDLIANVGLRKAVIMFVKGVMEKMDAIVQQQEADEEQEREKQAAEALANNQKPSEYEGDSLEKGVVVRKGMQNQKGRRQSDDFGDEFGGDVFDVEEEEEDEDQNAEEPEIEKPQVAVDGSSKNKASVDDKSNKLIAGVEKNQAVSELKAENGNGEKATEKVMTNVESQSNANSTNVAHTMDQDTRAKGQAHPTPTRHHDDDSSSTASRRELLKNRAPPAGYQMGPAGGAAPGPGSPASRRDGYGRGGGRGGRGYHDNNFNNQGGRGDFQGHQQGGRGDFQGRGRFQQYPPFDQGRGRGFHGGRGYQGQVSFIACTYVVYSYCPSFPWVPGEHFEPIKLIAFQYEINIEASDGLIKGSVPTTFPLLKRRTIVATV